MYKLVGLLIITKVRLDGTVVGGPSGTITIIYMSYMYYS